MHTVVEARSGNPFVHGSTSSNASRTAMFSLGAMATPAQNSSWLRT